MNKKYIIRIFISLVIILALFFLYNIFFNKSTSFKKEFTLLRQVSEFGDSLGSPSRLIVLDSTIIIIDNKPLTGFSSVQAYGASGIYLRSFGRQGQGPNEMLSPWQIFIDPANKNNFWIFDLALYRLTEFSLNGKENNKFITFKGGMPYSPILLKNGLIESPGFSLTKGRLAVYDTSGKMLKIIGEIPPGKKENVPVPVHQVAFQSVLKVKPDGSLLVLAVRYADMLEIYKPDGTLVKRVHGPVNKNPIYNVDLVNGSPVMAIDTKNSIIGYTDIALTNNYIYALFSGRTINEYHQKAPYGNHVHVFNWKGEILKVYKTDSDLLTIAVSNDENRLYAVQDYPKVSIVVYSLP